MQKCKFRARRVFTVAAMKPIAKAYPADESEPYALFCAHSIVVLLN